MKLIKMEDGLLELENYFLTTPIGDFLGNFICSRDQDSITLKYGHLERCLRYNNFVIVVQKDYKELANNECFKFYTRKDNQISGLIELSGDSDTYKPITHWKLIKYDNFIQGYVSSDDKQWINKGGGEVKHLDDVQGFFIEGKQELKITDYKIYRSPYLTIYNVQQGQKIVLLDKNFNVITEKFVDNDYGVDIYMDNVVLGYIKIQDKNNNDILVTPLQTFQYGDIFMCLEHELELYYKGELLDHKPTKLNTRYESVILRNASTDKTYTQIQLSVVQNTDNTDNIALSLNNNDFNKTIVVDRLLPLENQEIYIKIIKDKNKPNYGIRNFSIEIDKEG